MDDPAAQRKLAKKLERQQVGGGLGNRLHASRQSCCRCVVAVRLQVWWEWGLLSAGRGGPLVLLQVSAGCGWWHWSEQGAVVAIINTVWLQVPLRQDYGTKVNLFSHLHQYSRKKPLTQQMRYVASQPKPLANVWLFFGWPGYKTAVVKGYPGPVCGLALMGWQGTPSLALGSSGTGSWVSWPWEEESCPGEGRATGEGSEGLA